MGVLLPVVLFGLRHLPMDIYNGLQQGAAPAAWASRMAQLYATALLMGFVRHKAGSTWATWIMHECLLCLIIVLGLLQ